MVERAPVKRLVASSILAISATACSVEVPAPPRHRCDALLYVEQCKVADMPSDYGVAWNCEHMYMPIGSPPVILGHCVDRGDYKCCSRATH